MSHCKCVSRKMIIISKDSTEAYWRDLTFGDMGKILPTGNWMSIMERINLLACLLLIIINPMIVTWCSRMSCPCTCREYYRHVVRCLIFNVDLCIEKGTPFLTLYKWAYWRHTVLLPLYGARRLHKFVESKFLSSLILQLLCLKHDLH